MRSNVFGANKWYPAGQVSRPCLELPQARWALPLIPRLVRVSWRGGLLCQVGSARLQLAVPARVKLRKFPACLVTGFTQTHRRFSNFPERVMEG